MLRKIQTFNKSYLVNWTPKSVYKLLIHESIKANDLIQTNQVKNHRLIREFFLLACRASLQARTLENKEAMLFSHYARSIRQISHDYERLFRRRVMSDLNTQDNDDVTINSIDRLQARLFYLITQYSLHPCKHLAANIVNQLTCLCQHPHIELLPAQHYIYSQSINLWRSRLINSPQSTDKEALH